MGTAGALGLMERPKEPLLVMNGDILTQMDFCRSVVIFVASPPCDCGDQL